MPRDIVIVSHRRSGTHLTIDAINNNFYTYRAYDGPVEYLMLDRLTAGHMNPLSLDEFRSGARPGPKIYKAHSHGNVDRYFGVSSEHASYVNDLLSRSRIIYVYRDGRDVLRSLYAYYKNLRPEFGNIGFGDFLRMDNDFDAETYDGVLNRVEYWQYHVTGWLSRPDVLFVTFEQLRNDYARTIQEIADYIGEPRPQRVISVIRRQPVAGKLPGSKLLQKAHNLFMRKVKKVKYTTVSFSGGNTGGYKDIFSKEDILYFDGIAGGLLRKLGYLSP